MACSRGPGRRDQRKRLSTGRAEPTCRPWEFYPFLGACRRAGLYVVVEGHGAGEAWRVWSKASGKVIGLFYPGTERLTIFGRPDRRATWREAVEALAAAATSRAGGCEERCSRPA